eukprot:scaffold228359_cov18-Tisochrysis_lutea.AAC.1
MAEISGLSDLHQMTSALRLELLLGRLTMPWCQILLGGTRGACHPHRGQAVSAYAPPPQMQIHSNLSPQPTNPYLHLHPHTGTYPPALASVTQTPRPLAPSVVVAVHNGCDGQQVGVWPAGREGLELLAILFSFAPICTPQRVQWTASRFLACRVVGSSGTGTKVVCGGQGMSQVDTQQIAWPYGDDTPNRPHLCMSAGGPLGGSIGAEREKLHFCMSAERGEGSTMARSVHRLNQDGFQNDNQALVKQMDTLVLST